jgi:RNA polymerase sigma-70 factor (ECF subfamily)
VASPGVVSEEAALVARVAAGDEAAYRALLAAHLAPLNRYARRMLGDRDEADDVTQDVFVRLWTDAHRYRPEAARLTTWLHRIAHNLCVDWQRRHRRISLAGDSSMLEAPPQETTRGPEVDLAEAARVRRVRAAVDALPERQRSALVLCHYQGLGNREAAEIVGVSVEALESLLARARRTLRRALEEEHGP